MTCVDTTLSYPENTEAPDEDYDRAERETIQRGEAAMEELEGRRSWNKWIEIGEAMEVGRKIAVRESNSDKGKRYTAAFSRWLKRHPVFEQIDPAARKRLADCMKEREGIEVWHSGLQAKEHMRLNHPDTVLRHYRVWQREEKERKASEEGWVPPPKKPSQLAQLKKIVADQQAELDRREGEAQSFSEKTTVEDFLAIVNRAWSEPKAMEIMKGWVKLLYGPGATLRVDKKENKKVQKPVGGANRS